MSFACRLQISWLIWQETWSTRHSVIATNFRGSLWNHKHFFPRPIPHAKYTYILMGQNLVLNICTVSLPCILTHWGRVTHICVNKLTIIGSHNGLSPGRRQAIIWTNAGILLIRTLGTNFSEILGEIHSFSFSKTHLKMSSAKWRLFCPGLNVLTHWSLTFCRWHMRMHFLEWNSLYSVGSSLHLRVQLTIRQHCLAPKMS